MIATFCDMCHEPMQKNFQPTPQMMVKMDKGNPEPVVLCSDCWQKMSDHFFENESKGTTYVFEDADGEETVEDKPEE